MDRPRRYRSTREDNIRYQIQLFNERRKPKKARIPKDKGLAIEIARKPPIPDMTSIERKCGLRILDQTGLTIDLISQAFYACLIRPIPKSHQDPPLDVIHNTSGVAKLISGCRLDKIWIWTQTVRKRDNMGRTRACWCPSNTTGTLRKVCGPLYHFAICYKVEWLRSKDQQEQANKLASVLQTGIFHGQDDELQVTHTCGNHWCVNPDHLEVRRRSENQEQINCHAFLNSGGRDIRNEYLKSGRCKHTPACF